MKLTFTILSFCFVGCYYSQQSEAKAIKKNVVLINNEAVQPISGTTPQIAFTDNNALKARIAAIDSHVHAIDIKVKYVSSDQDQRERAQKMGWFDQMEKTKKELTIEKMELENKLKSNP